DAVAGGRRGVLAAVAGLRLRRAHRAAAALRAADLWVPCWARLHPGRFLGYRTSSSVAASPSSTSTPICNSHISSWMLDVLKEKLEES
ncbi:unnamed protein product, partial [Urochloa humidicola]